MDLSRYINIPYEKLNCWGLIKHVLKEELCINIPDMSEKDLYIAERHNWFAVNKGSEKPFDVLLFDMPDGPHVGLVIGSGKMLHTRSTTASVIERYRNGHWKHRLKAIYRHK